MKSSLLTRMILLLLLILPTTVLFVERGQGGMLAWAQDAMEGEDEEAVVEEDGTVEMEAGEPDEGTSVTEKEEEETEELQLKPSPDADTVLHFIKPQGTTDLPAGKPVGFLVGFTNKGSKDFVVETMEASFRYPQDYSFFLQNFTTLAFHKQVEPGRQATFAYNFQPSETFSGRPFGLSILLHYKDADGKAFMSAVFNETITVVEAEEGLDGETFFLYIFLLALLVLVGVGVHQLASSFGMKKLTKPKPVVEMGTQNTDVDYDWLPKETLEGLKKSPGRSPKKSPRQRRNKRSSGSGEE